MIYMLTIIDTPSARRIGILLIEGENLRAALDATLARGCIPDGATVFPPICLDPCREVVARYDLFRILDNEESERFGDDIERYVAEWEQNVRSINSRPRAALGN